MPTFEKCELRRRGNGPGNGPASETLVVTRAADIEPQNVSWLWPGWLARGKFHLLGGQPGAGKTTLALRLAAIISSGGRFPGGDSSPAGHVIIWSGEDDVADTLVPRLIASGADVDRIFFVTGMREGGKARAFDPSKDVEPLHEAIVGKGAAALLIVDPVVSAVAGDSHKNAEVRRGLQPLASLCQESGTALLGITHLTKGSQGREPVERIIGSIAFGAAPRIVMVAGKEVDSEDGTPGGRFLMRAKSNIGPDRRGFAFDLKQTLLPNNPSIVASIAEFGQAIEGSARDMLAKAEMKDRAVDGDRPALREAKDFLKSELAAGPKPVKAIRAEARGAGVSEMTLRRAKDALSLVVEKQGLNGGWVWSLPEGAQEAPPTKTMSAFEDDLSTFEEGHVI
jgi:putative DNA primase/helicase